MWINVRKKHQWKHSGPSANVIVSVSAAAAHLGFVNGAVQCIVLLVIQQTEVQGAQRSCRREIRRTESRENQNYLQLFLGGRKQSYLCTFIDGTQSY